ncbi:MAG: CBS domain-containing protein [Methanosarcinales archaeon]|nr:MAG: CBS domain-containing protein [Methanosarcinales archaeon]
MSEDGNTYPGEIGNSFYETVTGGRKLIPEFHEIPAKDIMGKRGDDLPLIEEDASIDSVLSILAERDHVWVVESKGCRKLVGIITEHDILNIFSPAKKVLYFGLPDKRSLHYETFEKAEQIMSENPIKCEPDDKVEDALNSMVCNRITKVPVVENDEIIGEITLHHLIGKFYEFIKTFSKE